MEQIRHLSGKSNVFLKMQNCKKYVCYKKDDGSIGVELAKDTTNLKQSRFLFENNEIENIKNDVARYLMQKISIQTVEA